MIESIDWEDIEEGNYTPSPSKHYLRRIVRRIFHFQGAKVDKRESEEFQAIAMGQLNENPQFQIAVRMACQGLRDCFAPLKSYGIESHEGIVFACESGYPVVTATMEPHMREHLW